MTLQIEGNQFPDWGRNAGSQDSTQITMVPTASGAQSVPPSPGGVPFQHRNDKCPEWLQPSPGPFALSTFCWELLMWFKVIQVIYRTLSNVYYRSWHVEARCFIHPFGQCMATIIPCQFIASYSLHIIETKNILVLQATLGGGHCRDYYPHLPMKKLTSPRKRD